MVEFNVLQALLDIELHLDELIVTSGQTVHRDVQSLGSNLCVGHREVGGCLRVLDDQLQLGRAVLYLSAGGNGGLGNGIAVGIGLTGGQRRILSHKTGRRVHLNGRNGIDGILRACIVIHAVAVVLASHLGGVDRNGHAVDGQTLIVVVGAGLHRAGDLDDVILGLVGVQHILIAAAAELCSTVSNGPVDNVIQVRRAGGRAALLNAGDLHLIFQVQVAGVADAQLRQPVCSARLPQNLRTLRGDCSIYQEIQRLALGIRPIVGIAICIPSRRHFKAQLQFTGLDGVDVGGGGVREPREGRAHQHDHAHDQRHDTGQQCALGLSAFSHVFVPLSKFTADTTHYPLYHKG